MNPDPEVQARRAAKRARPEDRRRRLRRYSRKIASVAGKRLGAGSVRDPDALWSIIETMADVALLDSRVHKLVIAAHGVEDTANALMLLCGDVMEDLQWFGASLKGWAGFDVRDPKTWPHRTRKEKT